MYTAVSAEACLTASTAVVDAALPMQSSLDAVLPLALRDLERSRLLIESLARNLNRTFNVCEAALRD